MLIIHYLLILEKELKFEIVNLLFCVTTVKKCEAFFMFSNF